MREERRIRREKREGHNTTHGTRRDETTGQETTLVGQLIPWMGFSINSKSVTVQSYPHNRVPSMDGGFSTVCMNVFQQLRYVPGRKKARPKRYPGALC